MPRVMSVAEHADRSPYRGGRFPSEIIAHAVWLYFRFDLSFRDVQDLLAERGIIVSHETHPPVVYQVRSHICGRAA
jgi:transposase-like protein